MYRRVVLVVSTVVLVEEDEEEEEDCTAVVDVIVVRTNQTTQSFSSISQCKGTKIVCSNNTLDITGFRLSTLGYISSTYHMCSCRCWSDGCPGRSRTGTSLQHSHDCRALRDKIKINEVAIPKDYIDLHICIEKIYI
jgi:hypothetical protein